MPLYSSVDREVSLAEMTSQRPWRSDVQISFPIRQKGI